MAKRDDALTLIVIAAFVAICIGLLYYVFKPRPRIVKGNSRLVETVDDSGATGSRGMIKVIDNVNFDLDKFEPKDKAEELLLAQCRFAALSRAVADAYNEAEDAFQADMRQHFDVWSKAVFYESKGEYKKAILLFVDLSKQEFRSPRFKNQVYLKLANLLEAAGDHKQSLKATLRAVETLEKSGGSDPAALKGERVRIMKELNALGGS